MATAKPDSLRMAIQSLLYGFVFPAMTGFDHSCQIFDHHDGSLNKVFGGQTDPKPQRSSTISKAAVNNHYKNKVL